MLKDFWVLQFYNPRSLVTARNYQTRWAVVVVVFSGSEYIIVPKSTPCSERTAKQKTRCREDSTMPATGDDHRVRPSSTNFPSEDRFRLFFCDAVLISNLNLRYAYTLGVLNLKATGQIVRPLGTHGHIGRCEPALLRPQQRAVLSAHTHTRCAH